MTRRNYDRILSAQELSELIPYSRTHIRRLEKEGHFPARVRIGLNRVGWSLNEVNEWIEERKNERDLCIKTHQTEL